MPGAHFVATAARWRSEFGRQVRFGERPIVALQPFGPVIFVYDVSQTESIDGRQLPFRVENAFSMPPIGRAADVLARTIENAKTDLVRVNFTDHGSQAAGKIGWSSAPPQRFVTNRRTGATVELPVEFQVAINHRFNDIERYATLAHELGHLFCGHIGTPDPRWWPNRRGLDESVREFEAEVVAYLACQRIDDDVTMPEYLDGYLTEHDEVPEGISLGRIMTAAGRVIEMGQRRMAIRTGPIGP